MNYAKLDVNTEAGHEVESIPMVGTIDLDLFPRMWRAPFGGSRLYFNKTDPFFYSGLTGPIGRVSDKRFLRDAAVRMAFEGRSADEEWGERAEYGSCFHLLVALHERGELVFSFDNKDWHIVVDSFMDEHRLWEHRKRWVEDIQNDFYAYFQWKKDYEVEVLATEIMVANRDYAIATPLDIVCTMKFNKGRIMANVNLKTGDKGFSDDYATQAGMEAWLFNMHWDQMRGSFCFRPKARKTAPGNYEMSKNHYHTDEASIALYEHIAKGVKLFGLNETNHKFVFYSGQEGSHQAQHMTAKDWLTIWQGHTPNPF